MQFHNPEDHNLYIQQIRQEKVKKSRLLKKMYFDEKRFFFILKHGQRFKF
jgi:hypothetical protein